jgi:hypothetical protein
MLDLTEVENRILITRVGGVWERKDGERMVSGSRDTIG